MTWLLTVAGALLVLLALRDIFRTLWYPAGFGALARGLCRAVWRATKPLNRHGRSTELAGPLGLLVTVLTWTVMITVGFALVYWPHLPEGFHFASSLDPGRSSGFLGALYVSLTALATLGLGDVVPAATALRVVIPVQALVGFVLLTATITWALQVYPALTRRRALAHRLDALSRTGSTAVVRSGVASVASQLLHELSEAVATVHADLVLYSESYFFRESAPERSLAATLPVVLDLQGAGAESPHSEVRHAASVLAQCTEGLARTLVEQFLVGGGSTKEVLRAFAADHQQTYPESR